MPKSYCVKCKKVTKDIVKITEKETHFKHKTHTIKCKVCNNKKAIINSKFFLNKWQEKITRKN